MAWSGAKEAEANRIAREQHGLIKESQLLALGCSRRTIGRRRKSRHWHREHPGVYRLSHSSKSAWHQNQMALILWAGEGAFASGAAAAFIWGLDGTSLDPIQEVSIHNARKHSGRSPPHARFLPVHRVDVVPHDSLTEVDGIPVARVERVLLELCAREGEAAAEEALDSALRKKLITLKGLRLYLDKVKARGRPGMALLRRLVDAHSGNPKDSGQENRFLTDVVRANSLPEPEHNFKINEGTPDERKIDFVFIEQGVAVELHSKKHHVGAVQRKKDTEKANLIARAGLTLYVFWNEDVRQSPRRVAAELKDALERGARLLA